MSKFQFTFNSIEKQYKKAINNGYHFYTCQDYVLNRDHLKEPSIVNRVDVDFSLKKAKLLGELFNNLGIKATFFIRLHAPEYNPFSFESYLIVKFLIQSGHEIGYHSEIVDQATIWNEDTATCLQRDIDVFNRMFDTQIDGIASHGGMTGLNNLDFWKDKKAEDFGLLYEAYDRNKFDLFHNSFYISDSEWVRWKCYDKGILCKEDRRSLGEHLDDLHPLIYLLIHSDTYFDNHFYE